MEQVSDSRQLARQPVSCSGQQALALLPIYVDISFCGIVIDNIIDNINFASIFCEGGLKKMNFLFRLAFLLLCTFNMLIELIKQGYQGDWSRITKTLLLPTLRRSSFRGTGCQRSAFTPFLAKWNQICQEPRMDEVK